jgi:hypothetical protein
MSVRIVDVREITKPISSPIRNAYIDFTKMTTSLVAVVTDVVRDGKKVVGYGFNSNGRYGQGGLIRERFAPRLMEADPKMLLDTSGAFGPPRNDKELRQPHIQQPPAFALQQPLHRTRCDDLALVGVDLVVLFDIVEAIEIVDHQSGGFAQTLRR